MKVAVQAMSEAVSPTKRTNAAVAAPIMRSRNSGPAMKQSTLSWKAQDKYGELLNFEMGYMCQ